MRRTTSQDYLGTVSSSGTMEQELVYEKLPADIAQRHVLLMDPILATGHSAERAINVPAPPNPPRPATFPRRFELSFSCMPT